MMVHKILKAPVNLYFDITPISRITGTFTRELYGIQVSLYSLFQEFAGMLMTVAITLVMTLYVFPYMMLAIVIMVFLSI